MLDPPGAAQALETHRSAVIFAMHVSCRAPVRVNCATIDDRGITLVPSEPAGPVTA
jgi:hypothetical protein